MWINFVFLFVLKFTCAFNSPNRLNTPSVPNSNHNQIYHSIYHHSNKDKDSNIYYSSVKNKTNNKAIYSLNSQFINNQPNHQTSSNQQTDVKEPEQRMYLGQAHIQFTLDLLGNILMREFYDLNEREIKSFNFSPLSVQSLLMLMHLASNGHTRSQIETALYLEALLLSSNSDQQNFDNQTTPLIHKIYSQSVNNLLLDKHIIGSESLSLTNKLFYKKDLKINPYFEQLVNYYYQKPLKQVDFTNQRETLYTINNFINKESKGLIKEFITIPPTSTSSMVAANAIYFKSNWKYKFDRHDTENDAIFYRANGKKNKVSMMIGKFPVAYGHSKQLKCSIIELPYKLTRLSMFFILPENVNGLLGLVRNLNATTLTDLIASMRKTNKNGGVNVRIPKFEIDTQINLMSVLNSLGIRSLFNGNECDLSNMITTASNSLNDKLNQLNNGLKNNNQLNTIINQVNPTVNSMFNTNDNNQPHQVHVNEFSHKAILQIDEQGSLGAGASATIVERIGMFNGAYFEADHPFIYFLTDKQTGLILFSGIFANPSRE